MSNGSIIATNVQVFSLPKVLVQRGHYFLGCTCPNILVKKQQSHYIMVIFQIIAYFPLILKGIGNI